MSDLDTMISFGRKIIGAPYGWWGGGELEACEPMYVNCPGLTAAYVKANTVNCSGLINAMQYPVGWELKGGTLYYGNVIDPWENFDPSRWYPCGTILVEHYEEGVSEGHVAIISRPNQLILQSNPLNGANEWRTASEQHLWTPWDWAGWLPGCPNADSLPGWGSGSVLGYPGDWADPIVVAAYMADVAEYIYGIPGILPVMTSCVELTDAWTGPGDVKNVRGYLEPVDHYSVGYFQQQYDDNPQGVYFGWGTKQQLLNPEFALSRFLDVALEQAPQQYPTLDDPLALAEWAQRVQNSAFPAAYMDKGYPMARDLLQGRQEPTSPPSEQTRAVWETDGWYEPKQRGSKDLIYRPPVAQ